MHRFLAYSLAFLSAVLNGAPSKKDVRVDSEIYAYCRDSRLSTEAVTVFWRLDRLDVPLVFVMGRVVVTDQKEMTAVARGPGGWHSDIPESAIRIDVNHLYTIKNAARNPDSGAFT